MYVCFTSEVRDRNFWRDANLEAWRQGGQDGLPNTAIVGPLYYYEIGSAQHGLFDSQTLLWKGGGREIGGVGESDACAVQ